MTSIPNKRYLINQSFPPCSLILNPCTCIDMLSSDWLFPVPTGALPIIHITLLCYPAVRHVALLLYILLSTYGIYCATTARTNVLRLRAFAWQAAFRLTLFLFRLFGSGVGSPRSLRLFFTMDVLAALGGVVNIVQVPERLCPGLFDNWGNSHQIMHVMVICSIVYLHWGTLEDLDWIRSFQCPLE